VTDITVHPEQIAQCAQKVGVLTAQSSNLNNMATSASVPELSWGALGHLTTLYFQYDGLLQDLHTHFTKMSDGFDKISSALRATAQTYHEADHTSAENLSQILNNDMQQAKAPGAVITAAAHASSSGDALGSSYGNQWAIDGGKGNLVSQTAKAVPIVNASYSLIKDSAQLGQDAKSGNISAIGKDITGVLSDMNSYVQDGIALAGAIADPLNYLISKGLGWLLNVVAPLKQAVDLVTGDPDATSKAATTFQDIAKQTEQLAKTYDDHLRSGLQSWSGKAGDAAATKLAGFHDGIEGTATTAGHIAALLQGSSMLMKAAEDIIKGILSDLIEWLVVTWVAAQLAAPETLGASEGVAAGASAAEAAEATAKATTEVNKVRKLLTRIMDVLKKVREVLKESKIGKTFVGNVKKAQEEGTMAKTLSGKLKEGAKSNALKSVGWEKSKQPDEKEYVDPVKGVSTWAGRLDGGYQAVKDYNQGNQQDDKTVDSELDV
jgi:uncharacterized protein YukE